MAEFNWFRLPMNGVALEKSVVRFREGLGSVASGRSARPLFVSEQASIANQLSSAHELYLALVAPLQGALQGKRNLT